MKKNVAPERVAPKPQQGRGTPRSRCRHGQSAQAQRKTGSANEKLQEDQRAASGKLMAEIRKSGDREAAREKFGALREEYQKKMRAILTEEQAKKLDEMRKQFQNRRPGQRPGGEGKGKARPGQRPSKKGSEASIEGIQYVLNDDRDRGDHRRGPGHHHDRDHGREYDHGDDDRAKRIEAMKKAWTERMKQGHHGRPDHGKNVEAAKKAWAERIKQAVEARRKAASSQVRGPQGPRPPFGGFGHGRPGPNGPQARSPRPGFGKPSPAPKGPQVPNWPGRPGPKGPQARGPRPGFGKPSPAPKAHRFAGNSATANPAVVRVARMVANPARPRKVRRPVARVHRMANLATANQNAAVRRDALTVITAGAHAARHGDHKLN